MNIQEDFFCEPSLLVVIAFNPMALGKNSLTLGVIEGADRPDELKSAQIVVKLINGKLAKDLIDKLVPALIVVSVINTL